jgi:hypothetical protein
MPNVTKYSIVKIDFHWQLYPDRRPLYLFFVKCFVIFKTLKIADAPKFTRKLDMAILWTKRCILPKRSKNDHFSEK